MPQDQMSGRWFYIPAMALFLLIILAQRTRMKYDEVLNKSNVKEQGV